MLLHEYLSTKDTKGHEEGMGFLAAVSIDMRVSCGQGCGVMTPLAAFVP